MMSLGTRIIAFILLVGASRMSGGPLAWLHAGDPPGVPNKAPGKTEPVGRQPRAEPHSQDRPLAVIQKAPDFSLTTQDDKPLRLSDLRGKVLLVSFVFTTCSGSCPATTHRMGRVQEELKDRGLLRGDHVRLVSITLDPARDTPDVLRRYAKLYDADLSSWSFLSGPPARVQKVISAWGMWTKPGDNGQLNHPSRVFLVDPKGQIREIYNLDFLKPKWVADDVASLRKGN
jgi:protein SCO1